MHTTLDVYHIILLVIDITQILFLVCIDFTAKYKINFFICLYFSVYEQLKFRAKLS